MPLSDGEKVRLLLGIAKWSNLTDEAREAVAAAVAHFEMLEDVDEPPEELVEAVRTLLSFVADGRTETVAGIAATITYGMVQIGNWLDGVPNDTEIALYGVPSLADVRARTAVLNASEHDFQRAMEQVIRERSKGDETE